MRDDFAIFVLSHGRANKMKTVETMKEAGYTGKLYIICDNEDKELDDYIKNFGKEKVIIFDKKEKAKEVDTMDSIEKRNVVVFARNTVFDIAEKLGLTYFLELDDDYELFRYRYVDKNGKFTSTVVHNFDQLVDLMLEFLDETNATSVAFGQTGDMIGGEKSQLYQIKIKRKVMNTFFCKVDRRFDFIGRLNEDTTTYTYLGSQGKLFMTIADITLEQVETQYNKGGLTDSYLENGTYVKSFYTVMCMPSCVKVDMMVSNHPRIHHLLDYNKAFPKIISDRFKKSV